MAAINNKDTILSYFRTGSIPNQTNYENFIDSVFLTPLDNTINIIRNGNNAQIGINRESLNLSQSPNNSLIRFMKGSSEIGSFTLNQATPSTIIIPDQDSNQSCDGQLILRARASETIPNNNGKTYYACSNSGTNIIFLSNVAFSGSYRDLVDKPDIPDMEEFSQQQSDWAEVDNRKMSFIRNKPDYSNGILSIRQNGVDVRSFNVSNNVNEPFKADSTSTIRYLILPPDWNASETAQNGIVNKPNLARVATTGSYRDLTDKPNLDVDFLETIEDDIEALKRIGGRWIGRDFNTRVDLFSFNTIVEIPHIKNGDYTYVIRDENHKDSFDNPQLCLYRWHEGNWVFAHVVQEDPIGAFTNSAFGFIRGDSDRIGYVNAQSDGTGKVNLLPTVLDFDCTTRKIWLSGEIPDGYGLFGFSKGELSVVMETELVSCNSCFCEYKETITDELCDPQWKTFIVCDSSIGPTVVGLRDWVITCQWVTNNANCDPDWVMFDITDGRNAALYDGHNRRRSNPTLAVDWYTGTNLKDAFVMHDYDDTQGYFFDITSSSIPWNPPVVDLVKIADPSLDLIYFPYGAGETHSIMGKNIPASTGIVNKIKWVQDNHSYGNNVILKVILYRRTSSRYTMVKTIFMTSSGGAGVSNSTISLVNTNSSIWGNFLPRNITTLTNPNDTTFLSSRITALSHEWFEFDLTKPDWNDQWKCLINN